MPLCKYCKDFVPRMKRKKEKDAKVQTAKTMWVPGVNNLGTLGRWAFLEIDGTNLHKTKQEIRNLVY